MAGDATDVPCDTARRAPLPLQGRPRLSRSASEHLQGDVRVSNTSMIESFVRDSLFVGWLF